MNTTNNHESGAGLLRKELPSPSSSRIDAYAKIYEIAEAHDLIISTTGGLLVLGDPNEMVKEQSKRNPTAVMDLWGILPYSEMPEEKTPVTEILLIDEGIPAPSNDLSCLEPYAERLILTLTPP